MTSATDVPDFLRQNSLQQTIPANTWLFQQDDPIRDIYLLEKGIVKLTRVEANGAESIGELRIGGAILGAVSALANAPAPLSAFTLTECKVAPMTVTDFLHFEQSNRAFSHALLVFVSQQKGELSIRYARQTLFSARAQLAYLLLLLQREFGEARNGERRLAAPLTKQDMAGWVGITPQPLSALLREMKRDGLLAEENGWIIFCDLERLTYEAETGAKSSPSPALRKGESELRFEICSTTEEIFSSD